MLIKINQLLDNISEYLAHRKGLIPLLGILLIIVNLLIQLFPISGWLVETNLLLHLGIIIAILGIMIAWAL
jgi:hypothetical protein